MQRKLFFTVILLMGIILASANAQWEVTITATSSNTSLTPQERTFRVEDGATDGFDRNCDVSAPPPPNPPILLDSYFPLSGNPYITRLSKDCRAPADLINWEYKLRADQDGGTLSWDTSNVPASTCLTLETPGGTVIDMKTQDSTPFDAINGDTQTYTITAATENNGIDTTPPVIKINPVISSAPAGTDLTITAAVTDNGTVAEVRLYYQVGGGIATYLTMSETEAGSNTYSATIPQADVNNRGLSYYIWAKDGQGAETTIMQYKDSNGNWYNAKSRANPQNVTVTGATVTLPAGTLPEFSQTVPSKYRMLSVPIQTKVSDADTYITSTELLAPFGTAGEDWLAWRFTGVSENNGYQAGHVTAFDFAPGVAAWVATTAPDNALTATGNTIDVTAKASITLHLGWNQIGNPFNFSRSWDNNTITFDSGVSNRLYWFTGETSEYSFACTEETVPNQTVFADSWKTAADFEGEATGSGWPGTLDPWGGYWVYSSVEGAKLYIDPTTPTKGVIPPTPAPSAQVVPSWSVKLLASSAGSSDATKFAGVVLDTSRNVDQYDVRDLPLLPGSNVRLSFVTEDGDYLQDMKAPADEMTWQLKATSATQAPVKIKFDARAVPSEYRTALLVDKETEKRIDLRSVSSYTYSPSNSVREFKLIISKANPEVYAAAPDEPVLLQNYPNPFNPETWIPFKLALPAYVEIRIYNLAGQLVRKIDLGNRPAGIYLSKDRAAYWNGRNNEGEKVSSGVYFYHLKAGDYNATKRMLILK